MSAPQTITLSGWSPTYTERVAYLVIDGQNLFSGFTDSGYVYWILDRSNPGKLVQTAFGGPSTAPPAIQPYLTDQYILCVTSQGIQISDAPTGDLYQMLKQSGAGKNLVKFEQFATQFVSGMYGCSVGYQLFCVPGRPGIDAFTYNAGVVDGNGAWIGTVLNTTQLTVQLVKSVGGYTPV